MAYKKSILSLLIILSVLFASGFVPDCFAVRWHTQGSDWDLKIEPEIRVAFNETSNTGDLNSSTTDDLSYASYIYNIPVTVKYKTDISFFINFISEGPSHYAAPLKDVEPFVEGVRLKKNGGLKSTLYPGVNEVWLKLHPDSNIELQIGQSPYKVGHGYALGGQYNNYGVMLSYERVNKIKGRIRYSILDYENRVFGIRNDTISKWDLGRSDDSEAVMLSADATFQLGHHTIQPYAGILKDSTPNGRRNKSVYFSNASQAFSSNLDKIYTLGLSTILEFPQITFEIEGAKNFGKTSSITPGWSDIDHKGYLIHTALKGHLGMFTPRARVVLASGNKVDTGDPAKYAAGTLKRTENRAFAVFSPLNANLVDSFAHIASVPVVAMAGGYPMNYGIRRPGVYNDPHVWENIIAYNLGVNIIPLDKTFLMVDLWHLRAMEPAIGQSTAGGAYQNLSQDIGNEIDIYATYSITKMITVGIHGGYFWPGDYYKEVRSDSMLLWNNNGSQTVRTDGSASNAHQMEVFVTLKF